MIVTEEEAKTKRCCGPEGCGVYEGGVPLLRTDGRRASLVPGQPRMCIGSACMAWRWHRLGKVVADLETTGSCGLAGG